MRRSAGLAFFLSVLVCARSGAQGAVKPEDVERLHGDTQAYIAALEDPARDAYQKPKEVVAALRLRKGQAVADIGSGSGYFTLRLAQGVGPKGRVYAVDIEPQMVLYLNRRVRDAGLTNVLSVLAEPNDPLLPDRSVDVFFICDTWHHIENQDAYLALMKKGLRPGGRVVVIDFHKKELPVGPPVGMKVAREDVVRQIETNGFRVAAEHTFLPYQYFIVFARK